MNSPIKFLLVDDLDSNLVALEALLQREGLELLKAGSGPEALELLLVHDIALAFLDVQMPEMDGFELAEVMRGTERTRGVPIIFLTAGEVDQKRRIRGYETGAVDFLPKPIDPTILLNKAATFFELALQRQALRESEARIRQANEKLGRINARLASADRSKDEFLAMLAHELRNPLAPLRNSAEILQSPAASPAEREQALEMIGRQIANMSHMIDDLLDVSRITEGKIELRRQPVALAGIFNSAARTARAAALAADQKLSVDLPEVSIFLDADPTRLEQIVGNLLNNACKYSGHGSSISLSAEVSQSTDDSEVVIRVKDNGIGIDPELLPRIFDLFVQSSRSVDRSHGGLGIGLTVVSRLVKLHGGTIDAHSQGLGHGTEFTLRLPILTDHVPPLAPPVAATPPQASKRPLRVLIVDDNRDAAESMAMLQEINGHQTRVAHSGPQALVAALEFIPDVVILDIGLPGMDGYEVAAQLRTVPGLEELFIVALTGYGSATDRQLAESAGFDEHLVKPADLRLLQNWMIERIQTHL
jgi:signal transduction histidine kinase